MTLNEYIDIPASRIVYQVTVAGTTAAAAPTPRRREHRREQHGDVPADDQRLDGVHRRRRLPGEAHEPWTANVVLTEADGSDAYLDLIISQVTTQIELDLDDDFEPAGGDPDETIFVQGTIGSRLYVPRRVRVLTSVSSSLSGTLTLLLSAVVSAGLIAERRRHGDGRWAQARLARFSFGEHVVLRGRYPTGRQVRLGGRSDGHQEAGGAPRLRSGQVPPGSDDGRHPEDDRGRVFTYGPSVEEQAIIERITTRSR